MHAILITVRSSAMSDGLLGLFARHAEVLQTVPGLVMKTWLHDGERLGGFYPFATRETAEEYLAGVFAAELGTHPAFADRSVRHFAVWSEVSHTTGTPRPLGA